MNSNSLSITYSAASKVTFVGYSDSDLHGDLSGRKCVGGYVFLINGKRITCSSKKQALVSFLSFEAEYIALIEAIKEVLFIYQVFDDILVLIVSAIVCCDNNSALNLAKHPTNDPNSKHIDIRYHCIRAHVGLTFVLWRVDSSANLADMLTKSLAAPCFQRLIEKIGK